MWGGSNEKNQINSLEPGIRVLRSEGAFALALEASSIACCLVPLLGSSKNMGRDPSVLLLSDASLLPGAAVLWAMRAFENRVDGGRGLAVATNFDGKVGLPAASLDVLVSFSSVPGRHSTELLTELSRLVKSGGLIVVQEPVTPTSSLQRNLLLAGLVSIEALEPIDGLESSSMLRAEKPSWETGSSFAIKRKTTLPQSSINGAVVKLPVLDMNADDDELIDEDELLTEEDLKRPELPRADDCEVGNAGRKACKNCNCGRAEAEAAGTLPDDVLSNPQSSCGSCGLGDAFRCTTCPYRGLPPFKLGEKISLAGTLLTADV